jgi:hypothetical protein
MWRDSLFDTGYSDPNDPTTMFTSLGEKGSIDSMDRRARWSTLEKLKTARSRIGNTDFDSMIQKVNWKKMLERVGDPVLSRKMTAIETSGMPARAKALAKWNLMIENFGDDYLELAGDKSKRWGDFPVKYGVEASSAAYKESIKFSEDPTDINEQAKMAGNYRAVNGASLPIYLRRISNYDNWQSKRMGPGHKIQYFDRDKDGRVIFDSSRGVYSDGHGVEDNEFPGIKCAVVKNDDGSDKLDWRGKTIPVRVGQWEGIKRMLGMNTAMSADSMGGKVYGRGTSGEWDEYIKIMDRRAAGLYTSDKEFKHDWDHWSKEILWNKHVSPLENVWKWVKLEAPMEYMAMVWFGLRGHELHEVLEKETDKTRDKLLKHIFH